MNANVQQLHPEARASQALSSGDYKEVLKLLMDNYGDQIYRFCMQMVTDKNLAEDAHQMTFVQAYEGLGAFKGEASLRTWLFSIARNRCLDALKMTRRRERRITLVEDLPETSENQPANSDVFGSDLNERLLKCLQKLAPQVRSAVLMRFQEERSYKEMSQISSDKPATLQARVTRALPVLRRCLEQGGITSELL